MMFNKCANFAPGSQLCCRGADSSVHTEGKSATWTQRPAFVKTSLAPSPVVRSPFCCFGPWNGFYLKEER